MKSLNTKLIVSALGLAVMLTSPAFAKQQTRVERDTQATTSQTIAGYNQDGNVVAIPDPDQR